MKASMMGSNVTKNLEEPVLVQPVAMGVVKMLFVFRRRR